ncbi:sodium/solute symporter [Streptomyces apocyni]|uniref:sodium/solute symporter n=1 Tax=Streptomyces apocyni TaxID=2654677 RepID=UPI0012EABE9C|nr:cation acetate symporter [Streptomyces apocyni]
MNTFSSSAQTFSLVAFSAIASFTLLLCIINSAERDDLSDYYTGYRGMSSIPNGLAIAGDYISAATILNTVGFIALTGFDGLTLALSSALSLVLLMFLLAEPLRNAGRFTMGDALARHASDRKVRIVSSAVTLLALVPMMIVQLAASGYLVSLILGFDGDAIRTGCIVVLGILMIAYAAIGGMKGTALIQIIKIVVLVGASAALAFLIMNKVGWNPSQLLSDAKTGSRVGDAYLTSGMRFGSDGMGKLDTVSAMVTVVLGAACLPHVTMRMYTAHSARHIRRSMSWAVGTVSVVCFLLAIIGFGAAAIIGRDALAAGGPQGTLAILQVSQGVAEGSSMVATLLFTAVAAAVFLTLLSSVSGMIMACASSLAHDFYALGLRRTSLPAVRELRAARAAAVAVGVPAIALAIAVQDWGLQALITLSLCIGASAIAPALVYRLFWRRYTNTGLLYTMIGGTLSVLVLLAFSEVVSGGEHALITDRNFSWFPMHTTGLVTIPLGFFLGWLGTIRSTRRDQDDQERQYEAAEPRILAGAGTGSGSGS